MAREKRGERRRRRERRGERRRAAWMGARWWTRSVSLTSSLSVSPFLCLSVCLFFCSFLTLLLTLSWSGLLKWGVHVVRALMGLLPSDCFCQWHSQRHTLTHAHTKSIRLKTESSHFSLTVFTGKYWFFLRSNKYMLDFFWGPYVQNVKLKDMFVNFWIYELFFFYWSYQTGIIVYFHELSLVVKRIPEPRSEWWALQQSNQSVSARRETHEPESH